MRTKYMVIAGVLSVAIGVGWVFNNELFSHGFEGKVGPASGPPPAHAPALPAAEALGTGNPADPLPAWMKSAGPRSTLSPSDATAGRGVIARADDDPQSLRMRAAMSRLSKLQEQKVADPKEVEDILSEIERANGSSVLQGVRLDVLRENLRVAAKMQKAAAELQALQQSSATGELTPAQQAELNKKMADMRALQSEMRVDIMVGTPDTARQR